LSLFIYCEDPLSKNFGAFIILSTDRHALSLLLEVTNMINSNFYVANATWHSKGVASVARALGFA